MIDGELWTRFFLKEKHWHVNIGLGAYRIHNTNRAKIFNDSVHKEMKNAIIDLKKNIPNTQTKNYNWLNKSLIIKESKIMKLLPFFLYNRINNYIKKNLQKKTDVFDINVVKVVNGEYKKYRLE